MKKSENNAPSSSTRSARFSGMLGDTTGIRTRRGKDGHHIRFYKLQGYQKYEMHCVQISRKTWQGLGKKNKQSEGQNSAYY